LKDSHVEALGREVQRLEGLSAWLQQFGHLLKELTITGWAPDSGEEDTFLQESAQAIPFIVGALAAAGKRPGGLRLQQLRLPVFGSTPIFTLCRALSGCHRLRDLCLDNSWSGQTTRSSEAALSQLPAALGQLTKLTYLALDGDLFDRYYPEGPVDINSLVASLPRCLEHLCLPYTTSSGDHMRPITIHATSLQHLVALQRLVLPEPTEVTTGTDSSSSSSSSGSDGGGGGASGPGSSGSSHNPLAALTSLRFLTCATALQREGAPLLALPNLVELRAAAALPQHLEGLASRTALRYLACVLNPCCYTQQAAALTQLTQLTGLAVLYDGVEDDTLLFEEQWPPQGIEDEEVLLEAAEEAWGAALSTLTGLHRLRVEPRLLEEMNLAALTALTSIGVDYRDTESETLLAAPHRLHQVLARLAPLQGQLQKVTLLGLQQEQEEGCRAAVAAAVGKVEFEFT
jgi:hypothetical protein